MTQTAVEYIQEKLQGYGFDFGYVIEQAKEMEKQQIIDALMTSEVELLAWGISAEQYYNETYKQVTNKK